MQAVAQVQPLDSLSSEQLAQLPAWGDRQADLLVTLGTEVISERRILVPDPRRPAQVAGQG